MLRSRRKAREAAVQALYQSDSLDDWSNEIVDRYFASFCTLDHQIEADQLDLDKSAGDSDSATVAPAALELPKSIKTHNDNLAFARMLIVGTIEHIDFVDKQISRASLHWSVGRMARVDRNILRMAVHEIAFVSDVPVNVSINEAIEIAKLYGCDDSPTFINGVLDNIAKVFASNPDICKEVELEKERVQAKKVKAA